MPTNRKRVTRKKRARLSIPQYQVEFLKYGIEPDPAESIDDAWSFLADFFWPDQKRAVWDQVKEQVKKEFKREKAQGDPYGVRVFDRSEPVPLMGKDYAGIGRQYAQDVVSGRVAACHWVRQACQRQLDDLAREGNSGFPYRFDQLKAAHICRFIELLPHIKGKWAGKPIVLEPWQIFILGTAFGWVHIETGKRRFQTVYTEVPRKNAKSTISSGVALYMLTADGEGGPEVYSAATTQEQAKIVFQVSQNMATRSPGLQGHFGVKVPAHSIETPANAGLFVPLSSDGKTLDGKNVHCGVIDELHAHKSREVYDVIETGTGSREQPILWIITTAGTDLAGICYEVRTYLTKVLDRVDGLEDETFFGLIYTIDEDDDWTDPATWAKANPNFGVSVSPTDLERKYKKAAIMSAAQNNFLTKHLNVWCSADTAWMNMLFWNRCADLDLTLERFEGRPCWIGLDLASKLDINALIILFEEDGHYYVFLWSYLPEDTIEQSSNSQYSGWEKDGRLIVTPGAVIDLDRIEEDIKDLATRFDVQEIAYDPYQATQLSTHLMEEDLPMVELRPTVLNFSEPMKEVEALVVDGKLTHAADPVLTWMISNVVCHTDAKDNIYPRKERRENKIDGVVALIMAMNRAMAGNDDDSKHSQAFVDIEGE